MPMYRRVHQAIREVNHNAIFFLEPLAMANTGVPTFIEPLTDAEGNRDPLQAYMPHAYDIVLDTDLAHQPSWNRLDVIFSQKDQDAERMKMPLLIGEWGAFYGNRKTLNAARMNISQLDRMASGAFYWDYHRNIEKAVYFECLARPQPLALAGTLESQSFDFNSGSFQCSWNADPTIHAPSIFAAPKFWSKKPSFIKVTPDTLSAKMETDPQDMETVYVTVSTPDEPTLITLTLQKQ